jgi:hypothetical protein
MTDYATKKDVFLHQFQSSSACSSCILRQRLADVMLSQCSRSLDNGAIKRYVKIGQIGSTI